MHENLLELKNLSIGFNNSLYENINAKIKSQTLTMIVGENGVGKSCLLKTISSLVDKKKGEIFFNQTSIEKLSAQEKSKIFSILLTDKIEVDYLKVSELVLMGRSPYTNFFGNVTESDKSVAIESLKSVKMEDYSNHYFNFLSDGQKQKVLLARTLAQMPKIILLDEPTNFLDLKSKINLVKLLREIIEKQKVSILMSCHDLELVKMYSDYIWFMPASGKFQSGLTSDFIEKNILEDYFLH